MQIELFLFVWRSSRAQCRLREEEIERFQRRSHCPQSHIFEQCISRWCLDGSSTKASWRSSPRAAVSHLSSTSQWAGMKTTTSQTTWQELWSTDWLSSSQGEILQDTDSYGLFKFYSYMKIFFLTENERTRKQARWEKESSLLIFQGLNAMPETRV